MKNTLLLTALFLAITTISCKKSNDTEASDSPFIEMNVDGVKYREDLASYGTGFSGFVTCSSKEGFQQHLTTFMNSNIEAKFSILFLLKDIDFKSSSPGSFRIVEEKYFGQGGPRCTNNFDLFITFLDKKQNQQYCSHEQSGNQNTVQKITLLKTTSQEKTYSIEGVYNLTVTNSVGTKYKIDGKYKVIVAAIN